jgi:tetratricopeptide (TPR) repeat protein
MDVLDLLGSLVEKSLVMLDERDEPARYRMLETIRDYAREKLEVSGEAALAAQRHCEHYFVMAKDAGRGLKGPEHASWIIRLETELDNLRAAMTLAQDGGVDPFIAVKFAVAMQGFWVLRGYATEGRSAVRKALAMPAIQASDVAQAWALYVGAALASSQGDHAEASQMLETCLTLRRALGNPVDIAATLSTLALARLQSGDARGAAVGEREALQIFRQLGDRFGEAIGLLHLGQIAVYLSEDSQAQEQLEQCLAIARDIKNEEIEGECELVLGESAFERGDRVLARRRFARSLTVCREAGDKRGEAYAQWWLGKTDLDDGNRPLARERLGNALHAFRAFEMWDEVLGCLEDQAILVGLDGHTAAAASIAASATMARKRLRLGRPPRGEQRWQRQLGALRTVTEAQDFQSAWDEGCEWQVDRAIRGALAPDQVAVAA